jgi:hypothetical protein
MTKSELFGINKSRHYEQLARVTPMLELQVLLYKHTQPCFNQSVQGIFYVHYRYMKLLETR